MLDDQEQVPEWSSVNREDIDSFVVFLEAMGILVARTKSERRQLVDQFCVWKRDRTSATIMEAVAKRKLRIAASKGAKV